MAYVVTSACIDVKDGACVKCCPVDCIYEGARMFYIHPDECITCGICASVCPTDAIHEDVDLPFELRHFILINHEFFGPDVSGLGTPGGASDVGPTPLDHPTIATHPLPNHH